MSILSGPEIKRQVGLGRILIEPYNERQLNQVSYDVRLGEEIIEVLPNDTTDGHAPSLVVIDPKQPIKTRPLTVGTDGAFELWPGRLYLGHTVERIRTDHYVPTIDGKSSIGRIGNFIHVTAGYGEPGFDGQWTLEIVVVIPLLLYPGMRIGQMRFTTIEGEVELYRGNYTGKYSKGPVPSRVHRQFEQDEFNLRAEEWTPSERDAYYERMPDDAALTAHPRPSRAVHVGVDLGTKPATLTEIVVEDGVVTSVTDITAKEPPRED